MIENLAPASESGLRLASPKQAGSHAKIYAACCLNLQERAASQANCGFKLTVGRLRRAIITSNDNIIFIAGKPALEPTKAKISETSGFRPPGPKTTDRKARQPDLDPHQEFGLRQRIASDPME